MPWELHAVWTVQCSLISFDSDCNTENCKARLREVKCCPDRWGWGRVRKSRLWHWFLVELEMRHYTDLKYLTAEKCGVEKSEL